MGFTARRNVRGTVFSAPEPGEVLDMDLDGAYCYLEGEAHLQRGRLRARPRRGRDRSPPTGSLPVAARRRALRRRCDALSPS